MLGGAGCVPRIRQCYEMEINRHTLCVNSNITAVPFSIFFPQLTIHAVVIHVLIADTAIVGELDTNVFVKMVTLVGHARLNHVSINSLICQSDIYLQMRLKSLESTLQKCS